MKSGDILNLFTVHSFVVSRKWSPHSTVVDCLRRVAGSVLRTPRSCCRHFGLSSRRRSSSAREEAVVI